jgi:hypothetical protein
MYAGGRIGRRGTEEVKVSVSGIFGYVAEVKS